MNQWQTLLAAANRAAWRTTVWAQSDSGKANDLGRALA
jgi:hypothetical protein